jgi:hypothetical protein
MQNLVRIYLTTKWRYLFSSMLQNKEAVPSGTASFRYNGFQRVNQGASIASEGQTDAQRPHSVQSSALMKRLSPFSDIALTGHSDSHTPQLVQLSLIV